MSDESGDRWLIDGDCSKCRRKEYCGTECTASKRWTYEYIREAIRDKLGINQIHNILKQGDFA